MKEFFSARRHSRSVYLDYAATTPVDPAVMRAMRPYFSRKFANPGSSHRSGQEAFRALSHARKIIADAFGCATEGVICTASATEANNLAINGVIRKWRIENRKSDALPHIVTTAIEHDSVLEVCRALEREGLAEVTYVGVNREGIVDPEDIKKALKPETILVSVMYANNEIGTIQPISEIAKIIRNFRVTQLPITNYPLFHTDAVQAVQFLDCDMERLGVDLLTASAHKIYGPKGAAALSIRPHLYPLISPILFGGGQERGLRSGTENVPAIVGFGKAVELVLRRREKETERIARLRDDFVRRIQVLDRRISVNGSLSARLPNNAHVSFLDMPSDAMLASLDRMGVRASAGSACEAHAARPSHVLAAMGVSREIRMSSIRFSLGRYTKKSDIDRAVRAIAKILSRR